MRQIVLAIDDSPDIHRLLDVRLKTEDIELHHALTAEEGIAKAMELAPDLILLDLVLPTASGFELCRTFKADPRTAQVPIIFLTGTSDAFNKVQGLELGAVDYVTKPFEPAELCARVRGALRLKRYQDTLARRAYIDALTGLWNREYFNMRLTEEIAAANRYRRVVTLVMLDLDHFKRLNDDHGHPFGDRVLQAVGDVLQTSLRSTDAACRYGGEEFGLILTETPGQAAIIACERIQTRLAALRFPGRDQVTVSASFGVASSDEPREGALAIASLLGAADDALYSAKRSGRNRIATSVTPIAPAVQSRAG